MKRAPWLYTLMQIALWSIHGVLISYAQRYLAGMGMRDSAIGLLLGGATAAGFVLQPLLAAVCDRSRLTVRLTLLTGGGLMLLCCAALLPAAKSLTLTAAFYAVACCMAQTVPSFVNALGMAAERKGMRLNFGISRGAGSIGFGLTAQLANVLLLRGGLRTVPLYSLCLAAILTATAFCFPARRRMRRRRRRSEPPALAGSCAAARASACCLRACSCCSSAITRWQAISTAWPSGRATPMRRERRRCLRPCWSFPSCLASRFCCGRRAAGSGCGCPACFSRFGCC